MSDDLEDEWNEIEDDLRGDYDEDEEEMENRKSGWVMVVAAAIGSSILSPIFADLASAWFGDVGKTRESVIELTVEVRALKEQVTQLTNAPYATREELREVRTELTRFDERLDRIERK